MAKSARASVTKRNNRNLRAKVFGPAHDARTARLSAKLQELVAKPRPEEEKAMDVDNSAEQAFAEGPSSNDHSEEMELDPLGVKVKPVKSNSQKRRSNHKDHKVSKRKSKHSVVFASEIARKNKMEKRRSKR